MRSCTTDEEVDVGPEVLGVRRIEAYIGHFCGKLEPGVVVADAAALPRAHVRTSA